MVDLYDKLKRPRPLSYLEQGWIDAVDNVKFNLSVLKSEFKTLIEQNMHDEVHARHNVLIQKKFHLVEYNKLSSLIEHMPETKKLIETSANLIDFNFVTYRSIPPCTAYNWHYDDGYVCYHVPLTTNEGCWFVYEGRSFHMPADGSLYRVVNGKHHTFVNAGHEPRIHITIERI